VIARPARPLASQLPSTEVHPRSVADLLGLSTVLGVVLGTVTFTYRRQGITSLDSFTFFIPWFTKLAERLRAGDIPAWNPHILGGVPFAGDPESGWMYVPAMLTYLIFSPPAAFFAFGILLAAIGGFATYAFARAISINAAGATVAAVAMVTSAPVDQMVYYPVRTMVVVWLPVGLLVVERALRSDSWSSRVSWVALSGFGISQMLSGWLGQGSYYALLLVGGYIGLRTLVAPPNQWTIIERVKNAAVVGIGSLLIGCGLSAAGILPRVEAVERSNLEGGSYEDAIGAAASAGGRNWVLMLDRLISDDRVNSYYVAAPITALLLFAVVLSYRHPATWFFACLVMISGALATREMWLHHVFYLLPRFQVLHEHNPGRSTMVLPFGVAMLAGLAVDGVARTRRNLLLLIAAILATAGAFWFVYRTMVENDRETPSRIVVLYAAAVTLTLAWLLIQQLPDRYRNWQQMASLGVPIALVLLIAWEPVGRNALDVLRADGFSETERRTRDVFVDGEDPGGVVAFLREQSEKARLAGEGPFRYAGYDPGLAAPSPNRRGVTMYQSQAFSTTAQALLVGNLAIRQDLEDAQGYNPIQPRRFVEYLTALNGQPQEYHEGNILPSGLDSPLLDLLNVRYLIIPRAIPPGRPDLLHIAQQWPTVFVNDLVRLLENPDAQARAWIVHTARHLPPDEALAALASGAVDPDQEVLLESTPPTLAPSADPAAERVTVLESGGDEVRLEVITDSPGVVVISATYDPGWKATVNGVDTDVMPANGALQAVAVPAGTSTITLRYAPRTLQIGVAITGLTLILVVALPLLLWWRERKWAVTVPSRSRAAPTRSPARPSSPEEASAWKRH
jgi:hypothetical protein